MAGGRPSIYCNELAEKICRRIASENVQIEELCSKYDDMPHLDTIYVWVHEKPEFSELFLKARRTKAHMIANDIEKMNKKSDDLFYYDKEKECYRLDGGISGEFKRRMSYDMWRCEKYNPEYYGNRKETEQQDSSAESLKEVKERMEALSKERERPY